MEPITELRLCQIAKDADAMKGQAVADLDYEEAALWRDAKCMALEIHELRDALKEERLTDAELGTVQDPKRWLRSAHYRAMARELLELRKETGKQFVTRDESVIQAVKKAW